MTSAHSPKALRDAIVAAAALFVSISTAPALGAQGQAGPANPAQTATREASRLDTRGAHAEARGIFQRLIDSAATPAARAAAQRRMAMSYGFEGNCARAIEYEEKVIAYWKTREQDEPQNAFYQEGEMANEAARVCIDAGQLDLAEKYYRLGSELGNKEQAPRTHPKSLWDFRLAHALGRLAARRGNKDEALRQVAAARRALDSDSAMASNQENYFPYLVGYVALYTNDLQTAESELTKAIAENRRDPFMHVLLAMTYERLAQPDKAKALYEKAYAMATSHNPPAAFARPFARMKLGIQAPD